MKQSLTTSPVSPETFHEWSKLEPNEQEAVRAESDAIDQTLASDFRNHQARGKALKHIRDIMLPKRIFVSFLNHKWAMSKSSAYRDITLYEEAEANIPAPILEVAIRRGVNLKPELIKQNPPPKTTDPMKITEYLNNLKPMTRVEVADSPDALLKECIHFVSSRWARLPNNQRSRTNFMRSLMGMLLAKFGVAHEQSFAPMAVPDSFIVHRGRPKAA